MAGLAELPTLLNIPQAPFRSILALHDTVQEHHTTGELQSVLREISDLKACLETLPDLLRGPDEQAAMEHMGVPRALVRCGEYCEGFNEDLKKWLARVPGVSDVGLHSHSREIKRTVGEIAIAKVTVMFGREIAIFCGQLRTGPTPEHKTALVQDRRMQIQGLENEIETISGTSDVDFTSDQRKALSQRAQMTIESLAGKGSLS